MYMAKFKSCFFPGKFDLKYERSCIDQKAMLSHDAYLSGPLFILEPCHDKLQTTTINLLQLRSLVSIISIALMVCDFLIKQYII